jgi:hypothetical protein
MAYPPTSDLTDALNSGVRFFEVEDSLGSYGLVRRQLQISSASAVAIGSLHEGHWVQPDAANLNQYVSVNALLADNMPAYVVASLTGAQGDVKESGGVTGLQGGGYVARTKVFDTVVDVTYAPGDLLTVTLVDIGDGLAGPAAGGLHPGLIKSGATAANAVAVVEFYDAAQGILVYRSGTR